MSFFYNATARKPKAEKKPRLQDIPVSSLRQMGCKACPRDADAEHLKSPKMRPSGPKRARVYVLGSAPSEEDDRDDVHFNDKAGAAIVKAFGRGWFEDDARSGYVQQCRGDMNQVTLECCRGRVLADIEEARPEVIVTVGDAPLSWILGRGVGALPHRGSLIASRVGNHTCWVYPILYPNFVNKKSYGRSEYETALEHDAKALLGMLDRLHVPPKVYAAPYDDGITAITGNAPGDMQRLDNALRELVQRPRIALDIETNRLRPFLENDYPSAILTASVGTFGDAIAFSLDHPDGWGSKHQRERALDLFFSFLRASGRKCAHNLGFELEWFAWQFGPEFIRRTEWDDSMAMAHSMDERAGTLSLDVQTRREFGFWLKDQSHVDVRRPKWWEQFSLEDTLRYNALDTKWTDLLRDTLDAHLSYKDGTRQEYERKLRLIPTLTWTSTRGLDVDFGHAKDMHRKFDDLAAGLEKKIARTPEVREYEGRFGRFDPGNSDHVLRLMKEVCHRDEVNVERKGVELVSTDEEVLASLPARDVPSAPLILEHRGATKIRGYPIAPVLDRSIVCTDGKIRSSYGCMIAVTGRLNSEDPNVQNWPKRKHREVRKMIVGPFAACDYGQIEFRVVAMASEDENLVKYCWTGYDVHQYWAKRMIKKYGPIVDWAREEFADTIADLLKKNPDEDAAILKTLRQEAKNKWVFPQLFGASLRMCAEQLHLPIEVAQDLGEEFWDDFPGVKKWQERLLTKYEKNLYVETLSGRRRRGPQTKNEIINHPIQGTAADIVTEGMVAVSERGEAEDDPDLIPALNVHDDLTFQMDDSRFEAKLPIIAGEMCKPRFDFINVPLIVEASVGPNWYELNEVKVYRSNEIFNLRNPYA